MKSKVGIEIRRYRKEKKLTLADLASKAEISISYLSDIEQGRTNPSMHTLVKIASALDATVSELLLENRDHIDQEILTLARKVEDISEEDKRALYDHLEKTVDLYLEAIKRKGGGF